VIPTQGRVEGKVALVAGAASGIGRATAILLAEHGAAVWCSDRDADGAATTARSVGGKSAALDVTREADWEAVIAAVVREDRRLNVLVNSAGISFACPVADMSLDDWRRVLLVNLDGVFLGTKHAIRAMRATGGSVVNVSSAAGLKAAPGASAYSTSKAAVCMFSRTAAKECADAGLPIRVNTVCPGGVKTPLWRTVPFFQELIAKTGSEDAAFQAMLANQPAGSRFADPEEIAYAILYLASDESRFVTGSELVIDAGFRA
jgi:NAD(P)-dependent dehydrogenase (short-subunit alcohol dehydrogenase family)